MGDSVLLVEKEPPIGWLIFNRPEKLNALSTALWSAIPKGLAEFEADPEIRVIVVRGAGERAFRRGRTSESLRAMIERRKMRPPRKIGGRFSRSLTDSRAVQNRPSR